MVFIEAVLFNACVSVTAIGAAIFLCRPGRSKTTTQSKVLTMSNTMPLDQTKTELQTLEDGTLKTQPAAAPLPAIETFEDPPKTILKTEDYTSIWERKAAARKKMGVKDPSVERTQSSITSH